MSTPLPEPWLRGPLPGIPALLQPAAHAFVMGREDVDAAVRGLSAVSYTHLTLPTSDLV